MRQRRQGRQAADAFIDATNHQPREACQGRQAGREQHARRQAGWTRSPEGEGEAAEGGEAGEGGDAGQGGATCAQLQGGQVWQEGQGTDEGGQVLDEPAEDSGAVMV